MNYKRGRQSITGLRSLQAIIWTFLLLGISSAGWGQSQRQGNLPEPVRGLTLGIVSSSLTNVPSNASATPGFAMGIFNLQPITGRWKLSSEITYSQKGVKVFNPDRTFDLHIDYVEVPIAASYSFLPGPFSVRFMGGGYLGIVLTSYSSTKVFDDQVLSPDEWLETLDDVDSGLVLGTGIDYTTDNRTYGLVLRYTLGWDSVFKPPAPSSMTNQTFSVLMRISF